MGMNEWKWMQEVPPERRVFGATCRVQDRSGILTWNWPSGIAFVYIYGYVPGEEREAAASFATDSVASFAASSAAESAAGSVPGSATDSPAGSAADFVRSSRILPPRERLKLYTREEYKAKGGYAEWLDRYGVYAYRVYPAVRQDGAILVYAQEDEGNEAFFNMGKAEIRCSIKYRSGWFAKGKTVRMTLTAEVPVPKEALCYVKKSGGVPQHVRDGTAYPLLSDLQPGVNPLPEIDIGRDDAVRFFFTDGKRYGERFELIHA